MPGVRSSDKSMVTLWLEHDLHDLVEQARTADGMDRSRFLREAIVAHLRSKGYTLSSTASALTRQRTPRFKRNMNDAIDADLDQLTVEADAGLAARKTGRPRAAVGAGRAG